MDRLNEILKRKEDIKKIVETTEDVEELRKLNAEVDSLIMEEKEIRESIERRKISEKLSNEIIQGKKIDLKDEVMVERSREDALASKEYRSAWAKAFMGKKASDNSYTTEEIRAVGDAIGTTATAFTEATESAQGINNLGLLIPTSVNLEWLKITEQMSPIFRDITKLEVEGNIDLTYLFSSDDAENYSELKDTKNEGQEYRNLKITGKELAKDIEITWMAEKMTVEGFISFLLEELKNKMSILKINNVIYGDGNTQATGITHDLTPKEGNNVIDLIKELLQSLPNNENKNFRAQAKVYIASDVADELHFYKDSNGNYPYLVGGIKNIGNSNIEIDPYLKPGDILAGDMKNYIWNTNQLMTITKEIKTKPRRVIYGAYEISDGLGRPDAFAYGKFKSAPVI